MKHICSESLIIPAEAGSRRDTPLNSPPAPIRQLTDR